MKDGYKERQIQQEKLLVLKTFCLVKPNIATPGSEALNKTVTIAGKWYKDAYAMRTNVWLGLHTLTARLFILSNIVNSL